MNTMYKIRHTSLIIQFHYHQGQAVDFVPFALIKLYVLIENDYDALYIASFCFLIVVLAHLKKKGL